jgi:hypothetical protein
VSLPDLPDVLKLNVSSPGVAVVPSLPSTELSTVGPTVIVAISPGPPGATGAAGDGGFTHTQSAPAATWTIPNTLGRYPAAVLVVVGDQLVITDVEFPDLATIVVSFATPQAGRAEII